MADISKVQNMFSGNKGRWLKVIIGAALVRSSLQAHGVKKAVLTAAALIPLIEGGFNKGPISYLLGKLGGENALTSEPGLSGA